MMSIFQWLRFMAQESRRGKNRQRRKGGARCRPSLELLEDRALLSTVMWNNPAGGDWDTPVNWSTSAVPTATDDAVINFPGITVTHSTAAADLVHSLTSQANINFSAGSLSIGSTSSISGALSLSGGTIAGAGTLTETGQMTWAGGVMSGTGSTVISASGGTLDLTGSNGSLYLERTLVNDGTASWTGGAIYFYGGTLTNNSSFSADTSAGNLYAYGYQSVNNIFGNAGTFTVQGGGTTTFTYGYFGTDSIAFNNSGSVVVQGSSTFNLSSESGGSANGSFSLGLGSSLDVGNYTLLPGAAVSGAGTLVENSGTLTISGAVNVSNLTQSGGVITGPGTLTITTQMTWAGGTQEDSGSTLIAGSATLDITGSSGSLYLEGTLQNNGTADWTGGIIYFQNGTLINDGSFIADTTASNLYAHGYYSSDNAFDNNGTFTVQGGNTLTFQYTSGSDFIAFNNSGSVVVQGSSTFDLSSGSGGSASGSNSFSIGLGSTLDLGNYTIPSGGSIGGAGTLSVSTGTLADAGTINVPNINVSGGTLSATGVLTNLQNLDFSGGTLTGSANFTIANSMIWAGGTLAGSGSTLVAGSATLDITGNSGSLYLESTLQNNGTADWTGGTIYFQNGTLSNDGTFTVDTTASNLYARGYFSIDNAFDNYGTFTVLGGNTLTFSFYNGTDFIAFNNSGSVALLGSSNFDLSSGSNGSTSGSNSFSIGQGSTLDLGNYTISSGGSIGGAGTLSVSTGTLADAGTINVQNITVSGGTLSATGVLTNLQNLNLSGGTLTGSASFTITNSMTWAGGTLAGSRSTLIAGSATLDITGSSGSVFLETTLQDNGTTDWTGGTIYFLNGTLINDGSFTVDTTASSLYARGYFSIDNAFDNYGTLTVQGGNTLTFAYYSGNDFIAFNNSGIVVVQGSSNFSLSYGSGGSAIGSFNFGLGSSLDLGNYTLLPGATVSGAGALLVDIGNLTLDTAVAVQNLTQTGSVITGPGTLTVTTQMTWSGGTLAGSGSIIVAGSATLDITGSSGSVFLERTLQNNGTADWTGGTIYFQNGTLINDGSFTADTTAGDLYARGYFSIDNAFDNNGTFTVLGGNTLNFQYYSGSDFIAFNNSGSVVVQGSSTFDLSSGSGGSASGFFNIGSGSSLDLGNYTLLAGATVSGVGSLQVDAGTLTTAGNANVQNINVSGGTLAGTGVLTVSGTMSWDGGTLAAGSNTRIASTASLDIGGTNNLFLDGTLENDGTASWTGGQLLLFGGALVNNGTFTAQTSPTVNLYAYGYYSINGAVTNNGEFINQGPGTTTIGGNQSSDQITFSNPGTLNVSAGTVLLTAAATIPQVNGNTLSGGTWNIAAGATLSMNATITASNASITLAGPGASFAAINGLTANGGSLALLGGQLFSTTGNFTNSGNLTLAPASTLAVTGSFTQTAGTGAFSTQISGSPGSGQYGRITLATGTAAIAGTLNVALLGGFVPASGAVYPIISALGGASGTFSAVNGIKVGPVTFFSVSYPGTGVNLNAQSVSSGVAIHFAIAAPASITAGIPFSFTINARDAFGNPATGYSGTVHFTGSDPFATLPASATLSAGTGSFSATLFTAGGQTLTASDTGSNSISGASAPITVNAAAATHLVLLDMPSTLTAGTGFSFTVVAEDPFNNTATGYTGTVHFAGSDPQGSLPIDSVLDLTSGTGLFGAVLRTAGTCTITATDTVVSSISGSAGPITVVPAAASQFVITGPPAATAGVGLAFTVTAQDPYHNLAAGYSGTIRFTSTDGSASLPGNSTLSGGVGSFSATLDTAGYQALTATGGTDINVGATSSISGTSKAISVSATVANHFVIQAAASATAGNALLFTVTAEDRFNNVATGYDGSVRFTSSDPRSFLPASGILNSGSSVFSSTLTTAGSQTLIATDTGASTITGISNAVSVAPSTVTHFAVNTAGSATVGTPLPVTLKAKDAFNNTVTNYAGTVELVSGDSAATLPAPASLTSGTGVFSATLRTEGSQTLIAYDTLNIFVGGITSVNVSGAATHFLVSAPAVTTAGNAFIFQVTALDSLNFTAAGYSGTVHFSSSDSQAGLQANVTLTSGTGSFAADLRTAGVQTITATDVLTASVTGVSNPITVNAAAASRFLVGAPGTVTSASPFTFTVTAQDRYGNTAFGYGGTVHFSSSDTGATVPGAATLSNGAGVFSATLKASGNQTLTATDTASLTGSTAVNVTNAAVTHFVIIAPSNTSAGNSFVFAVTALDPSNNTVTNYSGTVHFASSDSQAVLPANTTLTGGVGLFAAVLKTAGSQTLTASDVSRTTVTGASGQVLVTGLSASRFVVTPAALPSYPGVPAAYPGVPGAATSFASAGAPVVFSVVAEDAYGNLDPNYHGTVGFASSDSAAAFSANSALTAGQGTFSVTLQTAGNQVISAADVSNPSISGSSSPLVTRGLVATSFSVTPSGFTITFDKPFNPGTVLMYTAGVTPDDIILATTNSQVSVRGSAIINASDTGFTFVKTDSISATGVFNPASGVLAAGNYTLTLRSLANGNGFADALGAPLDGTDTGSAGANYRITFSVSAPPVAVGIPDFARGPSNTDALFLPSTLINGSTFALSYTNPAANPTTGTATITFSTTAATLQSSIQAALSSGGLAKQIGVNASANNTPNSVAIVTNDTSAGANVLVTFQSALAQATNQLLSSSTAGVSIGPATINVANNIPGSGIPIGLSSGLGVTSGSFTLQYNPSLLTISGAVSKVAGASFTLVSNTINSATSATAVLSLSSPASLSSTAVPVIMGTLLATVPLSATSTYGAKQLLHFSSESLAGTAGSITVTNADAVQVAAYLGDVTDLGGPLNLQDAGGVGAVAGSVANTTAQTIPGFAAFPNLDPAIIGDVSLQGSVNSTDTGAMTQEVGGLARVTIPYAPIGLPVTPAGPGAFLPANAGPPTSTVAHGIISPADMGRAIVEMAPTPGESSPLGTEGWLSNQAIVKPGQQAQGELLASLAKPVDSAIPQGEGVALDPVGAFLADQAEQGTELCPLKARGVS